MDRSTVFVSYSQESQEHAERVQGLAASLERDGCTCHLDVHKETDEDWPTWMTRQLTKADTVLCVVTATYARRFRDQELPDVGLGVGWEAGLIRRLLYKQKLHNDRIFPVLFDAADRRHIPLELDGYDHFLLDGQDGYELLLRKLLGRPLHERPQPGQAPHLPARTIEPRFKRPGGSESVEPDKPQTGPTSTASLPQRIAHSRLLDLGVASRFDELVGREQERQILDAAWQDRDTQILIFVAAGGVGKTALITDWVVDILHNHRGYRKSLSPGRERGWGEGVKGRERVKGREGVKGRRSIPFATPSHREDLDAFFDWSFYSQGTQDQGAANSGPFLDAALRHFGESKLADSPTPADTKSDRLAERIAETRTLLLLDGVEPLQHPQRAGGLEGRLKDWGLERLLKRLAQLPSAGGLCVLTSRLPLTDLKRFHGISVREERLDNLSTPAAARLLHRAGARRAAAAAIDPDDPELVAAARELKGHALTVQLLGGYLKYAQQGDIRRRDRLDWPSVLDQEQEGHASSLMGAYERWFEQQGDRGRRQLTVLRLLGLFDRPARLDLLDTLRSDPAIPGLTEPLAGPDWGPEDWNRVLISLAEDHRLISLQHADSGDIEQIDTHPLIRAWFAHRLRHSNKAAWIEGHRRLYQSLCDATEYRPDGLEGLQPLYQAVAHGCQAGLHQKVLNKVYDERILQGTGSDGFYSSKKLGAVGADLGAVACFFDRLWDRPSPNLSAPDQSWLLQEAATRLRALGRLAEALEPMRAGLEMPIKREDWKNAAISASNLSGLELTLGELAAATADAERSVGFADHSKDAFHRMSKRATHADALYQAGQTDEARRLFVEAESIQAERQPEYPRLYSLQGFRYCDLLLSDAERAAWRRILDPEAQIPDLADLQDVCDRVAERAKQTLAWMEQAEAPLLTIALDRLNLGRAAVYQALLTTQIRGRKDPADSAPSAIQIPPAASDHLDKAVASLRESGNMDYLPRGLLTRAWQRWLTGDGSDSKRGAAADLDEAWEIAERGPMPLYQADCLLTRVRLFGRQNHYPWDSAREDLAQARHLIDKHGYHRRDRELADTESCL
ncbi:toll/interleukin-1 receptor domain-containing protein [Candidatus Thiosymbion oneisti]|uniref:toll/interleukin-1 receptor domain-containing protein n=1 Tax=Candidatus Thiosymbion oneisti TaxID=589554 RepID=UPI000AA3DF2C|nr:toll/interleukin-1 receptor domain-containing protein [Candidatus Thiosymbion oneisti]